MTATSGPLPSWKTQPRSIRAALVRARKCIAHGFTKHELYSYDGQRHNTEPVGCCALGAIDRAFWADRYSNDGTYGAVDAITVHEARLAAEAQLRIAAGMSPEAQISTWNDASTQDQVLAAFDRAIKAQS